MRKHLNLLYGIEVLNGRLNLSKKEVEKPRNEHDTTSYVKKIGGRAYSSAVCSKYAIQKFCEEILSMAICKRKKEKSDKETSKVYSPSHPYIYVNEDIFGFMMLDNITLSKEEYEQLSPSEKIGFSPNGKKGYTKNITKKRETRFMMSPMINVSNSLINVEYNVCTTDGYSMPYFSETYSGVLVGCGNLDIERIGKFSISDNSAEFRDYAIEEELSEKDIELSREKRLERIEGVLRALQYLAIQGNQSNYLTDTSLKFIILGDYSWGNNLFQGVVGKYGIDKDALIETLNDNERFRQSPIWIGYSKRISDEKFKASFDKLKEDIKDLDGYDFVSIGSVKEAFDGYIEYLKENYK